MATRNALFIVNPSRADAHKAANELAALLRASSFSIVTTSDVVLDGIPKVAIQDLPSLEIAIVLGGDGTILRGAEVTRDLAIPLLGINLGRVGFMAEVEKISMEKVARSVIDKSYFVEERMSLEYTVMRGQDELSRGWALNEITVERQQTTMVELFVVIDGRPLSRWGGDGVICATPTGSTAYAFSAGGPVMWPQISALVLLPISAHALFARPMVVSPNSEILITIESEVGLLSADSLRRFELRAGDHVAVTGSSIPVKLAHVQEMTFTDRLVAKFKLPVEGWRGE